MNNNTIVQVTVGATAIRRGQICKIATLLAVPCSVLGEAFFGVAESDYLPGALGSFTVVGECEVEVDGALAVGGMVRTDANGRAVAAAATSQSVGMLLETGVAIVSGVASYSRIYVRAHNVVTP